MRAHLDDWAGSVAERTTRRRAAAVLGGLALGALRIVGMGHRADAKNNNSC